MYSMIWKLKNALKKTKIREKFELLFLCFSRINPFFKEKSQAEKGKSVPCHDFHH